MNVKDKYLCECNWGPPEFIIEIDQNQIDLKTSNLITSHLKNIYISFICPTCNTGRMQPLIDERMRIRMRRIPKDKK